MWQKRKNYFDKLLKTNLWTVSFYFIHPQNYLHIMRTFLNHIKNETLDEIKTSLENLWHRMIQLSEFFQYSFVLILKRKCLVGASRVRCGESGTPSTIIYTRWSSRRYELGCDAPVSRSSAHRQCSNYIWVIKKIIAYKGAIKIRGLTVTPVANTLEWRFVYITPSVYSDQVFSAFCVVLYGVDFVLDFMAMRSGGRIQTGATTKKTTTTASGEPVWTANSLHSCKAPSRYLNHCSLIANCTLNWEQIIVQF